ncbi:hypothetical protein [Butyrivibrio sp. XPD2002]|uniref:hypothetical protein n=1 Tax=Butyrivibrio sp. XPD2002 TaxID=1280665 RepID=UPI0004187D24|nr:hypothetical protein [Butyrivibrio sp. XPD2002]
MKNGNKDINFIKRFAIASLVVIILTGAVVFCIDPFYHYHKPWFGLKAVLNDKEYQCIGTLRHFDYDTLIVGSSVAENNDNGWYDEAFNCKSIKAIRSYGATADLCYLLDEAFASGNDIKRVFYNIDPSSLNASTETTYEMTGCPMYLYDHNPFNDVQYLYNKGVILEKIPYMIVNSYITDYNENLSYNWAKWKNFSSESALGLYFRTRTETPMMDEKVYDEQLKGNIELLTGEVERHPDTEFYFFFPAYSMLWWDGIYRTGERDAFIHCEKEMVKSLLQYDNVKVFCFQNEQDVITNLDNYMDSIHFSPEINKLMLDQMIAGEYQMTEDNYEEMLDDMKSFSDKIVNELIKPYEEQNLLTYEQIEE